MEQLFRMGRRIFSNFDGLKESNELLSSLPCAPVFPVLCLSSLLAMNIIQSVRDQRASFNERKQIFLGLYRRILEIGRKNSCALNMFVFNTVFI